jgi:tetratricopeptide (TPR) repeat protein
MALARGRQARGKAAATAVAEARTMTSAWTLILGVLETLVHAERRFALAVNRAAGTVLRLTSRGWGPVIRWLVTAAALLYAFDRTGLGDRPWLTPANVLGLAGAVLAWRWLVHARDRVVVEDFVDFTHDDPQAAKGLSTLLVSELGRLRELYGRVNDQLSTPLSLGVRRRGGAGTEPGSFLSVRADDVTSALNDAVASETRIQVGGINLPVGFLLGLVGRFARGPRIMGSVHADGTVTAQVVGPGGGRQWRVEAATAADAVPELAARMFNDLTLRSTVRTTAMRSFTEALELYWASHSTPRDRARNLRRAEGKLLQAIAEDERFDLAYYNLGVVYSKLAETEQQAAQAAEYVGPGHDPEAAHAARIEAAVTAFDRAVTLNRDRAEAVYALAVHEFARAAANNADADADLLDCVVCRCDRVLALDRRHAQAHDLKGMALRRARRVADAERSHRRAVVLSWRRVRSAVFAESASSPTLASTRPAATANLAAALHNLARVQEELPGSRRVRLARADRLYRRAAALAPTATRPAIHHARGRMLDGLGRPLAARESYQAALNLEPENPVHSAAVAAGYAASAETVCDEPLREAVRAKARLRADAALHGLAPIYRRTLELHPPAATIELRDGTLDTLRDAYGVLDDAAGRARIKAIGTLWEALQRGTAERDVPALVALKAGFRDGREWEREQVQIALARTLGRLGDWHGAAREYGELIALLEKHRPQGIVQHSLHAKHARALRNSGRAPEALAEAARGQLQDPLSASARREVGKAHFALLQYEEALEAFTHTLWITPNDPQLHWKLGFCHWIVAQERRDPDARRAALESAAECFGHAAALFGAGGADGWAWSRLWAGRAMTELEEDDEAVRHLRTAAGCAPTKLAGSLLLGELLHRHGEHDDARRFLRDALDLADELSMGANADADWGETLPVHQVVARARALEPAPLAPPRAA